MKTVMMVLMKIWKVILMIVTILMIILRKILTLLFSQVADHPVPAR
jgi:hypothetical protein